MLGEFRAFLIKQNVLALAIAVIVGGALGTLVTSMVENLIMPVVGAVIPGGDWREATVTLGGIAFGVGAFLGALIDFLIIGFVVWRISKAFIRQEPSAAGPAVKRCPFCTMSIGAAATRCPHCTSALGATA